MKSFKEFLKEAQDKPGSATIFEEYIVMAWNKLLVDSNAEEIFDAPFDDDAHQKFASTAFTIAKKTLRASGSNSKMIHSGADKAAVTKVYSDEGCKGPCATPKADIRTADSRLRLSLKENIASQLLSGGKTDAMPVFKVAEANYANESASVKRIESIFSDMLERITPPKSAKDYIETKYMSTKEKGGGYRKGKLPGMLDAANDPALRASMPKDVNDFLDKVLFVDTSMKKGLTEELNKLFTSDPIFKQHFTYEAASGAGKFTSIEPVANGFLVFESKTGKSELEMFESYSDKAIVSLSKKLKMRLRWKHGSKVVLAGDIGKKVLKEDHHANMLLEDVNECLNESIVDVFNNVKSWLKRFITRIAKLVSHLLKKGMNALYTFFDISLETVDVSW